MSTETLKSKIQREVEAHATRTGLTPYEQALLDVAALRQRIDRLWDELSRVTEERDKAAQNNQRNAKLLAITLIERDAARRRVEELEGLATGNECPADGGTWVEVFISNDRLNPEKGAATLGLAFPARLDAAEKGGRS